MKKIYDHKSVELFIEKSTYKDVLMKFKNDIFIVEYEKGEFVTAPFINDLLFQVVIEGMLSIYFVREDGEKYSLSNGKEGYILGDMDIFSSYISSVYTEATEKLICLAMSIEQNKDILINDSDFLRMICKSLAGKMAAITAFNAEPCSLSERVISYMKYKCADNTIKGLEKNSFHIHCSARQLQRILTQLENENIVEKRGKGTYKLIKYLDWLL